MTRGSAGGVSVRAFGRGRAQVLPLPQPLEPFLGRAATLSRGRWLGDGWLWYGLMLALPLVYGLDGLQASLHMVATGALGVTLYKLVKNHAVRERPYITHSAIECASAPLDRYSFRRGTRCTRCASRCSYRATSPSGRPRSSAWLLIALSRVILGLHYPTDVAAGAVLGGSLGFGSSLLGTSWLI